MVPGKKVHWKKNPYEKRFPGKWSPAKKSSKNCCLLKEWPKNLPREVQHFLNFLSMMAADDSTLKRCSTLTRRSHTHQTVGNGRAGNVFPGTIFPGFWINISLECIGEVGESILPWAIFLFRIFFNYLSHKFKNIKITVWKSDELTTTGNFGLDFYRYHYI